MPVILVAYVIRERAGAKNSRLVHILPNPGTAHFYQFVKQTTPPLAYFGVCKIRKLAAARPYVALHKVIIAAATEIFIFFTLLKHPVIIINPYPRINNYYSFKPVVRQFFDHLF